MLIFLISIGVKSDKNIPKAYEINTFNFVLWSWCEVANLGTMDLKLHLKLATLYGFSDGLPTPTDFPLNTPQFGRHWSPLLF